jgi:hypothetical protein
MRSREPPITFIGIPNYLRGARVPKHRDEVLLYEERLSRSKRRRILGLNTYGRKIESVVDPLLKL